MFRGGISHLCFLALRLATALAAISTSVSVATIARVHAVPHDDGLLVVISIHEQQLQSDWPAHLHVRRADSLLTTGVISSAISALTSSFAIGVDVYDPASHFQDDV